MSNFHFDTLALHAGHSPDAETGARVVPIYQTTSYVFKNSQQAADLFSLKELGNIYTRLSNPTTEVLEKRLAALEGGSSGLATASGMVAIFLALHNITKVGDQVVASSSLYGGTETLFRYTLPRMGVAVSFIDEITPEKVAAEIKANTKAVYIETIGNPKGDVPDIAAIAEVAHAHKLPLIIDNTFATGICRPFEHGADIIVYSCTKWIGGHGTSIGGAIIDSGKFDWSSGRFPEFTEPDESYHGVVYWDLFKNFADLGNIAYIVKARVQGLKNIGACMSPQNAWLFLQGLETLPLRLKKQGENALALAKWLNQQPEVAWVNYTGLENHPSHEIAKKYLQGSFGSVFGFGLQGGKAGGEKFINSVQLASHLANVGDAKTLVIHPGSTTHQQLSEEAQVAAGLKPEFVRVSVGIENIDDLIADFKQAMGN